MFFLFVDQVIWTDLSDVLGTLNLYQSLILGNVVEDEVESEVVVEYQSLILGNVVFNFSVIWEVLVCINP